MLISSYSKKNFITQTGIFSYELSLALNRTDSSCEFGFSGENGRQTYFNIISGKLLDSDSNFIYGISANESIAISGYINNNQHDYYINGYPIKISGTKTTGYAEWFYINPYNCVCSLDFSLLGEKSNIQTTDIYFSGFTGIGTGIIFNNTNRKIKLYTGISQTAGYRIDFPTGFLSNNAIFTGYKTESYVNTIEPVNFRFVTNFGEFITGINFRTVYPIYQEIVPQIFSYILGSGNSESYVSWENYQGAQEYTEQPIHVDFYFKHHSGEASGNYTGYWSLVTGLQDKTQLLNAIYYPTITGFSGSFETYGFNKRYFKISHLWTGSSGVNISEFWFSGQNEGFRIYITGTGV